MTSYRVFKKHDAPDASERHGFGCYEEIGVHEGHDARSAISAAVNAMTQAEQAKADGVTFAATPDGSWKAHVAKVITETKVRVG